MEEFNKNITQESILPDFLNNVYGGEIPSDKLCYKRLFSEEETRKVFRVRNKDLFDAFGEECEGLKAIQTSSKATITVLADDEIQNQEQKYLDLKGTITQVDAAVNLIKHKIQLGYFGRLYPVILMPPVIEKKIITIPLSKARCVIGPNNNNLRNKEFKFGTWMMIDRSVDKKFDRVINIYGPADDVSKTLAAIKLELDMPDDLSEIEKARLKDVTQPHDLLQLKNLVIRNSWKPNIKANASDLYAKLFVIRSADLEKVLPVLGDISQVANCVVAVLSNDTLNFRSHRYIYLSGIFENIREAHHLIIFTILETYGPVFPVITMPAELCVHRESLPLNKVKALFGKNILPIEVVCGAWIQFEKEPDTSNSERTVVVYGLEPQVIKALNFIYRITRPTGDAFEELEKRYKRLPRAQKIIAMEPRFRKIADKADREARLNLMTQQKPS